MFPPFKQRAPKDRRKMRHPGNPRRRIDRIEEREAEVRAALERTRRPGGNPWPGI